LTFEQDQEGEEMKQSVTRRTFLGGVAAVSAAGFVPPRVGAGVSPLQTTDTAEDTENRTLTNVEVGKVQWKAKPFSMTEMSAARCARFNKDFPYLTYYGKKIVQARPRSETPQAVYGMLGLGLTLFCLRALKPGRKWKEGPLKLSFWSLNLGLIFMVILSMLPVGLLQAWASIEHGTWYARSSEFMQSSTMQSLRWNRVPGDILFAIGAALFAWFVFGLLTGHSFDNKSEIGRDSRTSVEQKEHDLALAGD